MGMEATVPRVGLVRRWSPRARVWTMASTTAMLIGLTGLHANARTIEVVGNNIANVNTTAFKQARLNFSNLFSRTMSEGSAPADTLGGTNPFQIGYGVKTAGTQRNFTNGSIVASGDGRDMAIEGDGFFQVKRGTETYFTRAGNFRPDAEQYLTLPSGERLQGYGVDTEFNITPGALGDVRIPIGSLTLAEATRTVKYRGNLNANGTLPTTGSTINLRGSATAGLSAIAAADPTPTAPNLIESTTRLIDIEDPALPTSGTPLFASGQSIELRNAEKGNKILPTQRLEIADDTTVDDLNEFLAMALGINASAPAPNAATPGVSLDPLTGVLTIAGNSGTINDLRLDATDLRVLSPAGTVVRSPFVPEKTASATGESVRSTFVAFDSLGTPVNVDLTFSLESRSSTGTSWRYTIESADDSDPGVFVSSGVLDFDTDGQLVTTTPVTVTLDRENEGASTPLTFDLSFAEGADRLSSLTDDQSQITAWYRDGSALGTLSSFGIGSDGVISGAFTNGVIRTLGQIPLTTFVNNEGLVDVGGNLFAEGVNSGTPVTVGAGTLGAGSITSGSLELSNVDIGEEFIKMIQASTGYSAASRVIRTTDELFQQLLVLGR